MNLLDLLSMGSQDSGAWNEDPNSPNRNRPVWDEMPKPRRWQVSMPSATGGRATPEQLAQGYARAALPTQQPPPKPPGLLGRLLGPTSGMEGLLSDGDMKAAQGQGLLGIGSALLAASGPRRAEDRVPLMAAVAQGLQGGQNAYQQAAASTAALHQASRKAQSEQMELDKAKQREAIFKALPPPKANASPEETQQWMTAVMPHLINAGLLEDATQIAQAKKAMEADNKIQQAQIGSDVTTFDAVHHPDAPFYDKTANNGQGGWVKSIERGMPQDMIDLKTQAMKATADAAAARLEAAQATTGNARQDRLAGTWDKHVRPMTDRVQPVNQALMALDAAKTSPVVGANAIVAFMTAVDPKATQRYQMVNWISSHLTPSVRAKAIRALDQQTTGLLPADMLAEMEAHVRRTKQTLLSQEERMYNEYVKIHPEMKDQLTRINTEFEPDSSATPNAAAPPSGGKRQWKTADGTVIELP